VRAFIREASKRGYPIEDIVALLDAPGMTAEAVVERIPSTSESSPLTPTEPYRNDGSPYRQRKMRPPKKQGVCDKTLFSAARVD
jgi:hypothetical protein